MLCSTVSILFHSTDCCALDLEDQNCLFSYCNGGAFSDALLEELEVTVHGQEDNKSHYRKICFKPEKASFIDGQLVNKPARLWLSYIGGRNMSQMLKHPLVTSERVSLNAKL